MQTQRNLMKKLLALLFITLTLYAAEPVQYGAYYGDIKVKINNYNTYSENDVSSAGKVYLYKQKKEMVNYIYETKIAHIKSGLEAAKELAIKNKNAYFAIDNLTHQVVISENSVVVMSNYNVLAFD